VCCGRRLAGGLARLRHWVCVDRMGWLVSLLEKASLRRGKKRGQPYHAAS